MSIKNYGLFLVDKKIIYVDLYLYKLTYSSLETFNANDKANSALCRDWKNLNSDIDNLKDYVCYVDLSKDIFKEKYNIWFSSMQVAEDHYMKLLGLGAKPEEARSVLPNSIKTEIVVTMNLREWRHFFKLRTSLRAHPQMRQITIPLLKEFKSKLPIIFDDILI